MRWWSFGGQGPLIGFLGCGRSELESHSKKSRGFALVIVCSIVCVCVCVCEFTCHFKVTANVKQWPMYCT